jgi:hypothetical protein
MCLISTEIQKVSKTNILVAPNFDKTRQLTIYSNFVNNISDSNAMVLPVPLPNSIQFIDLSGYQNLFEDCAGCFYETSKSQRSYGKLTNSSFNTRDEKPLEVFNVGSYKVSLAKSLEEINRVDTKIFKLSDGLKQTLEIFYYQSYWGFIICKLAKGEELYHPFGYSHDIIDNKIYIPTRHYHQEVKWSDINDWALGLPIDPTQNPFTLSTWDDSNIDNSPMFKFEKFGRTAPEVNGWMGSFNNLISSGVNNLAKMSSKSDNLKKLNDKNYKTEKNIILDNNTSSYKYSYKKVADDWSHSIYLLNLNPYMNEQIKKMNSSSEIWDKKSLFDPDKINFNFGYCNNFVKLKINGTHPNIDLVIPSCA